jgi:hypothetical protein
MESAQHELGLADRASPAGYPLYSVQGVESRVQQELSDQFDAVVAFADFCSFLTSTRASDQADQLVELARALYDETAADLSRSRPRG